MTGRGFRLGKVLGVGLGYLVTAGRRRVSARVPPATDLTEKFGMRPHLHRVAVPPESPPVGRTVGEIEDRAPEISVAGSSSCWRR